ncbi:hypothetical protein GCM10027568_23990 [Humibacter soli]
MHVPAPYATVRPDPPAVRPARPMCITPAIRAAPLTVSRYHAGIRAAVRNLQELCTGG